MPLLEFPQYAPDLSDYEGQSTQTILNVVPLARGYGPAKDFNALSGALPELTRFEPRPDVLRRRGELFVDLVVQHHLP